MRAQRFLSQYGEQMLVILRLQKRLQALDDLYDIVQDMTREKVQTSPKPDKIGEIIAKKSDLKAELNEEIEKAKAIMDDVEAVISEVNDKRLQLLLHERYINFMTWGMIAEDLDLSDRWVQELHLKALMKVERIINVV